MESFYVTMCAIEIRLMISPLGLNKFNKIPNKMLKLYWWEIKLINPVRIG